MADPISGSITGGGVLRPVATAGQAAGGKVRTAINEDNVASSNKRGIELAEHIHENNQRHLHDGMVSPGTASTRAEDTKKFGQAIVDTQDKGNLNISAMRQNKKNEKNLQDIEKEQMKADAAKLQEANSNKADEIISEAKGGGVEVSG